MIDNFIKVLDVFEQDGFLSKDWTTMSIFADWCEENGEDILSQGLRWMAKNKRRPYRTNGRTYYSWFNQNLVDDVDKESDIPEYIYNHLKGNNGYKEYATYMEAIVDLSGALYKWRNNGSILPGSNRSS
jgi:hypothetical protein